MKSMQSLVRGATAVGVPGLILEHSFHTNSRTTEWLLNDTNLDKLAMAEAEVIVQYYDVAAAVQPEQPSNSTHYQVRVKILDLNIRKGPGWVALLIFR